MSHWQYADWEYALSAVLLVTAMFGMGASLTARQFWSVVAVPRGVLLILFLQVGVGPLLAWGLSELLALPAPLYVALLLIAALPGGLFSNLLTYLGRGHVALSITATSVATLGCIVATPAILAIYAGDHLPAGFQMPVKRILFEIFSCLLLPLFAGMYLRYRLPGQWRKMATSGTRVSFVLLLVMVTAGLLSGRVSWHAVGWQGLLAVVVFSQLMLWIGYALSLVWRFNRSDAMTVVIEVVVRNVHLAIFLKASLFPASDPERGPIGDAVLSTVLVYGGFSMIVAGIEVYSRRRRIGLIFGRKRRPHASTAEKNTDPS